MWFSIIFSVISAPNCCYFLDREFVVFWHQKFIYFSWTNELKLLNKEACFLFSFFCPKKLMRKILFFLTKLSKTLLRRITISCCATGNSITFYFYDCFPSFCNISKDNFFLEFYVVFIYWKKIYKFIDGSIYFLVRKRYKYSRFTLIFRYCFVAQSINFYFSFTIEVFCKFIWISGRVSKILI